MEKIYGYKQSDLKGLAEFIRGKRGGTLTQTFGEYARLSGKAKGTVRNMYYALCKACEKSPETKSEYFKDTPITVGKIVEFSPCQVRRLIKAVLLGKKDGRSARSVICELSNGDVKLALRLQNKYRSALKTKKELVDEIIEEIRNEQGDKTLFAPKLKVQKSPINDQKLGRLKRDIDSLVDRISEKAKRENEYLKERVASLELENLKLKNLLYGNPKPINALSYLRKDKDMVN